MLVYQRVYDIQDSVFTIVLYMFVGDSLMFLKIAHDA
jgi:hypothetical protein